MAFPGFDLCQPAVFPAAAGDLRLAAQFPVILRNPAVQAALLIVALWFFWNVSLVQVHDAWNQIGPMRTYARLWDTQDAVLKAAARTGKPVYLTTIADPFQLGPASSDQTRWDVQGEKDYYHLK